MLMLAVHMLMMMLIMVLMLIMMLMLITVLMLIMMMMRMRMRMRMRMLMLLSRGRRVRVRVAVSAPVAICADFFLRPVAVPREAVEAHFWLRLARARRRVLRVGSEVCPGVGLESRARRETGDALAVTLRWDGR